ncbi:MAG: SpoIIIAH-like family protein [Oscillospiraceae bacterium]|nr:SpoIIIAH-like family protein [Oscillospiraceae bacterium]
MKFKKPSLIIGKKQVIFACLTLMLGAAVYVNYVLAQSGELTDTAQSQANYGEAEFVSNNLGVELETDETMADVESAQTDADGYFAQARIEKMNSRDEAVETLQTILGGGDITQDEMVTQALEAVTMSQLIESENTIETLIMAQGFENCIVYLDGTTAKVVVKTDGLDAAGAAAIKDIILSEIEIDAENIRIFEINS